MFSRPVCLINAHVFTEQGPASSVRFSSRILSLDTAPRTRDVVLDLEGAAVFPGLINAHDHLELNHFGRVKFRDAYRNASEWIDDMRPRLRADSHLVRGQQYPLADRLFIGGLKNLLSGVTTVGHHNPFYPELRRRFPVRVLSRYGWAHSFFLEDGPVGARGERGGDVQQRFRATSTDRPFLIHLAEGVDPGARAELARLDALGCLEQNTVLIHGVGLGSDDWRIVARRGAGLVWCPASNEFLLGQSADIRTFAASSATAASRICLATDSRLTGSRDLLDEMRAAASLPCDPTVLYRMVTTQAAGLLRLPQAGRIAEGLPADLLVLPKLAPEPISTLLTATRKDVSLVTIDGRPLFTSAALGAIFAARRTRPHPSRVDGVAKLFDPWLAHRIARCAIAEAGVEAPD